MIRWSALVVVVCVVLGPLILPFATALRLAGIDSVAWEFYRWISLAGRTFTLLALVAVLVVPTATALAVFIGTANLPGRRFHALALIVAMAMPLPLWAVGWQGLSLAGWKPFDTGMMPAALMHALAGLPWMTALLVAALFNADSALIDEARTSAKVWPRVSRVLLPQLLNALVLGLIWLLTTVAAEVVITDLMQVRTFAEEVYTQFVSPAPSEDFSAELALARAVMVSIPAVAVMWVVAILLLCRTRLTSVSQWGTAKSWFQLSGKSRAVWTGLVGLVMVALLAVPLASLIFRAGIAPPLGWSLDRLVVAVQQAVRDNGVMLFQTLVWSLATGIVVSTIAGVCCWWARTTSWLRVFLLLIAVTILVTPAPIIGLGVKAAIFELMDFEQMWGVRVFGSTLYDGPSYLPIVWAWSIRSFPLALAILWPLSRDWPVDTHEVLRMETRSSWKTLRHVFWPVARGPFSIAIGLIAFVCFGEVSASRLTATPGAPAFAHDLFERMHFGLRPDLSACALLGVTTIGVLVGGAAVLAILITPRSRED